MMTLSRDLVATLRSVLDKKYIPERAGPIYLMDDDRTLHFKITHGDTLDIEFIAGVTVVGNIRVSSMVIEGDVVRFFSASGSELDIEQVRS